MGRFLKAVKQSIQVLKKIHKKKFVGGAAMSKVEEEVERVTTWVDLVRKSVKNHKQLLIMKNHQADLFVLINKYQKLFDEVSHRIRIAEAEANDLELAVELFQTDV